jgi:uncharacterized lipoprotein YmbA
MMTVVKRHLVSVLVLVLLASIAGCAGKTESSRYYVLAATEPDTERRADGPSVSIGPVSLPKYLDRPQVVTRPTPNQLDVSEFDRWGGRLEDNVAQVLAEDIARRLRTARVAVFPAEPTGRADSRVAVTITQFERIGNDGDVVLDARWRVVPVAARADAEPLRGNFKVSKHAAGSGYVPAVAAMSAALGDLAATIADAVAHSARGS